mgnify:FL=1
MFNGMKIGVGITGSFCSLSNCLRFLKELKKYPVDIYVFISDQVNSCDTRFFKANQLIIEVEKIIEAMQKEDVTLDESFKLYNQGLKIIKDCNQHIETIEKQIKIINEEAQQNV